MSVDFLDHNELHTTDRFRVRRRPYVGRTGQVEPAPAERRLGGQRGSWDSDGRDLPRVTGANERFRWERPDGGSGELTGRISRFRREGPNEGIAVGKVERNYWADAGRGSGEKVKHHCLGTNLKEGRGGTDGGDDSGGGKAARRLREGCGVGGSGEWKRTTRMGTHLATVRRQKGSRGRLRRMCGHA